MSDRVPEGWYADPQADGTARERWWNGVSWTAHTREAPAPLPPPAGPAAPSPAREQHVGDAPSAPIGPGAGAGSSGGLGAGVGDAIAGRPRLAADGEPLAGPAPRLAAWVIDALLVGLVLVVVNLGLRLGLAILRAVVGLDPEPMSLGPIGAQLTLEDALVLVGPVVSLGIWVVYQVWFLTRGGATPGKQLLGLVVRPAAAPGPVPRRSAVARALVGGLHQLDGGLASGGLLRLFLLVDAGFGLAHPRLQTLHDRAAGTVVVARGEGRWSSSRARPSAG